MHFLQWHILTVGNKHRERNLLPTGGWKTSYYRIRNRNCNMVHKFRVHNISLTRVLSNNRLFKFSGVKFFTLFISPITAAAITAPQDPRIGRSVEEIPKLSECQIGRRIRLAKVNNLGEQPWITIRPYTWRRGKMWARKVRGLAA